MSETANTEAGDPLDPSRTNSVRTAAPRGKAPKVGTAVDDLAHRKAAKQAKQETPRAPSSPPFSSSQPLPSFPYWLIVRGTGRGPYGLKVFTVEPAGSGKVLPVFGSEEAAEACLASLAANDEWRARRTGGGELLSVLSASGFSAPPCADVERVALDPSPEMLMGSAGAEIGLVCMDRRCFMERLMGRGRAWFDGSQEGKTLF